jgi:hypothetical protein
LPTRAIAQEPLTENNPADPAVELARQCLALHRENELLHRRWGDTEAWLADNHDWFKLNEAEQRALPAARNSTTLMIALPRSRRSVRVR